MKKKVTVSCVFFFFFLSRVGKVMAIFFGRFHRTGPSITIVTFSSVQLFDYHFFHPAILGGLWFFFFFCFFCFSCCCCFYFYVFFIFELEDASIGCTRLGRRVDAAAAAADLIDCLAKRSIYHYYYRL